MKSPFIEVRCYLKFEALTIYVDHFFPVFTRTASDKSDSLK